MANLCGPGLVSFLSFFGLRLLLGFFFKRGFLGRFSYQAALWLGVLFSRMFF